MGVKRYEELVAWQLASELRTRVIRLTRNPAVQADLRYCDQFRSAVASISANIAEGFGRHTRAEFVRFLRYARGSAFEAREWLRDGRDRGHLSQAEFDDLWQLLDRATGSITCLITSLLRSA